MRNILACDKIYELGDDTDIMGCRTIVQYYFLSGFKALLV
jgi:hypothetical protein